MDKKTKTNTSIKKILIFSGIGLFIMFLFLNSVFETPEQKEHNGLSPLNFCTHPPTWNDFCFDFALKSN